MTDENQFKDPQTQWSQKDDQNIENDIGIFGGSDDIFENSEILEPIDDIKSENNTNNQNTAEKKIEKTVGYTSPSMAEIENKIENGETANKDDIKSEEKMEEIEKLKEIPEVSEDMKDETKKNEIKDEVEPIVKEKNETISPTPTMEYENKDNENLDDDFFDPFNDEDDHIEPTKDENVIKKIKDISKFSPREKVEEKNEIEELKEIPEVTQKIKEDITPVVEEKIKEVKEDIEIPNFDNSPEIDALDEIEEIEPAIEKIQDADKPNSREKIEKVKLEDKKTEERDINIISTIEKIEKRAKDAKAKIEEVARHNTVLKTEDEFIPKVKKEITEEKTKEEKIDIPEINPLKTDLQNKFEELLRKITWIYDMMEDDDEKKLKLLGGNDDRIKTTYNVSTEENIVNIVKTELNKSDESTIENKLSFVLNGESLNVKVDNDILYDEVNDLQENPNKKMQVMDKLNKFIFLISEAYKKMEKEKAEKEAKKEKRNKMKWIFRNFMF